VQKVCRQNGLETIRGVEMSCYDYDVHKKVHVVGLGLNNHPYHVEKLCQKTLQCRDEYHHELIKILNQKGLNITYEDAKEYAPYNIVFKMHLFLAIVHKYPEYNDINKYRELFMSETSLDVDSKMGYIDIKEGIRQFVRMEELLLLPILVNIKIMMKLKNMSAMAYRELKYHILVWNLKIIL